MNWWIVLLGVLVALGAFLQYIGLLGPVLFALVLIVLLFLFYKKCIKKLDPYEAALIYRFGRYHRTSPSGWTVVLIQVITNEGLKVNLYALSYSFIINAKKAILNIEDYRNSLVSLIESRVRDIAGDFSFTQLFVNVEDVSELLHQQLNKALNDWGIALNMFEIERIQPPQEVMDALRGVKVAEETLSAKRFNAEARRVLVGALGEGTRSFDDRTTSYLYIKALENMKSAKMMMPAEFMDVMSPGKGGGGGSPAKGGSNLVKGMVAGTTFNKAMGMIGDVVVDQATLPEEELENIVANGKADSSEEHAQQDYPTNGEEEAAVGGFDGLDGSYDGTNHEYANKEQRS
jgi:hypothetical protein